MLAPIPNFNHPALYFCDLSPYFFPLRSMQAALTNTLSPGDKVVCFRYGQFSHLWIDMMQRLGLDVQVIDRPWGEGAHEGLLEEALRKVGATTHVGLGSLNSTSSLLGYMTMHIGHDVRDA